jgi:anaerobic selenocysteine-containing dehydrogenase
MNAPLDPKANSLLSKLGPLGSLLRQWEGPLTRELLLNPAGFGLGKVPDRLKPDATTKMVCGYCSTGCSLNIHLKNGQAVGLTPATDYPVNLGMACPKGWEALAVLDAPDRATTPLLRNAAGEMEPVSWDVALKTFLKAFRKSTEKIPSHGSAPARFPPKNSRYLVPWANSAWAWFTATATPASAWPLP